MRIPGAWILSLALAGCLSEPKVPHCGNSVECGNPKLAELQTTTVGCPGCVGGAVPVPFKLELGDSLRILLDSGSLSVDSMKGEIALFRGSHVPVFASLPLAVLPMQGAAFTLHADGLRQAFGEEGGGNGGVLAFSIRIKVRLYSRGFVFGDEGLLAGLGFDPGTGTFICSPENPLGEPGRVHLLTSPMATFRGSIRDWQVLSAGAESAYAYIPGSPFHTVIAMTDGRFSLDSLPYKGRFELRFFAVPADRKPGTRVASHILASDSSDREDRLFHSLGAPDSLLLP